MPKEKIKNIVNNYKQAFAEEYNLLVEILIEKRKSVIDEFARATDDTRALFEISETLSHMIIDALDPEELKWFDTVEGGRWFAKTFKEFSLPSKI